MNYYNEFDPKAAAWLRELIKEGHIPDGWVDERSIIDVKPHELTPYTQQHFFAGIGGWSLALQLAGWPDDEPVRTGSCPCQPFSQAGQQRGTKDERHLWPVFRDVITFGEPTVTFGEQVASKLGREWLAGIRADLEGLGYAVGAADLCAAGVGSPHIRQRLYWMADAKGQRSSRGGSGPVQSESSGGGKFSGLADSDRHGFTASSGTGIHHEEHHPEPCSPFGGMGDSCGQRAGRNTGAASREEVQGGGERREDGMHCSNESFPSSNAWGRFDILPCTDGKARRIESGTFPLAHGIPGRVGLLRGYGNGIVPEVAAEFIKAYLEARLTK